MGLSGGMVTGGPPLATVTNSARQTPSPEVGPDPLPQSTFWHAPALNTWLELEQDKQALEPPPEQLPQEESQDLQVPELESKYSVWAQVVTQRLALVRTGKFEGQERHWLKALPEQVLQSGWQATQDPPDEKVLDGQLAIQLPFEANWLLLQVKQKFALPTQVPQLDEQAVQVPSDAAKVPAGQLAIQAPLDRN